jgi:hypothetical protein
LNHFLVLLCRVKEAFSCSELKNLFFSHLFRTSPPLVEATTFGGAITLSGATHHLRWWPKAITKGGANTKDGGNRLSLLLSRVFHNLETTFFAL